MFDRLNSKRGGSAPLNTAVFVFLLTVLSSGAWLSGFDGIQGQHAIFYPSVELIYEHDDNWFRQPHDETSANIFVARPRFRLEVPGARQFIMIEYIPQFRDVDQDSDAWDLEDNFTHYLNINAKLEGSEVFHVDIREQFARGILETIEVDPNGELYFGDSDTFTTNAFGIDFKFDGTRQGAEIGLAHYMSDFDDRTEFPLASFGDPTYGGRRIHYGNVTGRFKSLVNGLLELIPRQALHARTLGFVHPTTRENISVHSDLPPDMEEALRRLEEYYGS